MENKEKTLYKGKTIIYDGGKLVNMTFSLPDDIHKRMRNYPEIKWSALARKAIIRYLERLEMMDELLKDSKLTEEDVIEMDAFIKKAMATRIKKKNPTVAKKREGKNEKRRKVG